MTVDRQLAVLPPMGLAWHTGAAVAAAILLTTLGGQLLLHRAARDDSRDDQPSAADFLGNALREAALSLWLGFGWPRGSDATADPPSGRTAVLVHGFGARPACMRPLARRLRRDGWSVVAPDLGLWWRDLESAATRLAGHLDGAQCRRSTGALVIVAHGLGGLAARLALARTPRLARELRLLVTLGTPHDGTKACPRLRIGPWWSDVRPGSPMLRTLRATPLPPGVEAIAIASPADAVVVPPEGARWQEACNVSVVGHGHLFLLVSATVHEIVAENLVDVPAAGIGDHAS